MSIQTIRKSPRRYHIVGTTGAGKSTVAREIAARLQIPHIEFDALYWNPDWSSVPEELFRMRVAAAVASGSWVCDGNYSRVRDLVWAHAPTIVFLDYSFARVFLQLLGRTLRRAAGKELLWGGSRESLRRSFFSRESILLWMLQSFGRNRRRYPALLQQPQYTHLQLVHLRSPRETGAWLENLVSQ